MNAPVELDVVIINYNSGDLLIKCIDRLNDSDNIKINIYIIDNDSSDQSIQNLEQSQPSANFKIIKNTSNLGYAKACNQGSFNGSAKYIAFLNTDCFIYADQLSQLISGLSEVHNASLIGCRVMNEDGSLQAATRRRLPTFWRIVNHMTGLSKLPFFRGININDNGLFNDMQKVEAVNGACWVIKRAEFELVGGFDEEFPLHFEDLDLFNRLQSKGFDIIYDSKVSVIHLKGSSSKDIERINNWKRQGLLRYLSKHRPKWEYKVAQFILGLK